MTAYDERPAIWATSSAAFLGLRKEQRQFAGAGRDKRRKGDDDNNISFAFAEVSGDEDGTGRRTRGNENGGAP